MLLQHICIFWLSCGHNDITLAPMVESKWHSVWVSHSLSIFFRNGNLVLNFSLNMHLNILGLLLPQRVLVK